MTLRSHCRFFICLLLAGWASLATGQGTPAKPPAEQAQQPPAAAPPQQSTPEERKRVVEIAHKLELAPLDQTLGPEREWALKWVLTAPDVRVRICTDLLADLRRPRYKYRAAMTNQLMLSSAAFLIEHPGEATDLATQSIAGMQGVLKAYSAILTADPQATASSLDAFRQKQSEGKLAAAVRESMRNCR